MSVADSAEDVLRSREARLVLAQWALLAPLAFYPRALLAVASALALGSALLAWRWRLARPLFLGGFVALTQLGWLVQPLSQLTFGLALALYGLGVRRLSWAAAAAEWWRRGRADGRIWSLTLAIAAVSATALLCWFRLLHPNVDDIRRSLVPDWPTWLLLGGGVVFALVNAAVEELVYRGLLQQALASATGSAAAAVVLQALAFGLLHLNGFPRGWVGIGMATVYGLLMGVLRQRAGGLLAPWLGHVLTDLSIVSILLFWTRG